MVLDGPDFQSGGQRNAGHFFVFEVDHIFGVLDDGGGVGGDEIFAFTDADDERTRLAGEDQFIGPGDVHDGNGVGADHLIEGDARGFEQVEFLAAAHDLRDEVHEHFGVGVAVKSVSAFNQGLLERVVVLDDAVVDQRQLAVAAEVWVGVDVVGWAVGGPAGVPDSKVAGGHVVADVGQEIVDLALLAVVSETALRVDDGNPRAVISAVFESLEPLDDEGKGGLLTKVSDDSTHGSKGRLKRPLGSFRPGDDERGVRRRDCGPKHDLLQGHGRKLGVEIDVRPSLLSIQASLRVNRKVEDIGVPIGVEGAAIGDPRRPRFRGQFEAAVDAFHEGGEGGRPGQFRREVLHRQHDFRPVDHGSISSVQAVQPAQVQPQI